MWKWVTRCLAHSEGGLMTEAVAVVLGEQWQSWMSDNQNHTGHSDLSLHCWVLS